MKFKWKNWEMFYISLHQVARQVEAESNQFSPINIYMHVQNSVRTFCFLQFFVLNEVK
jgi:hypothetical protein